MIDHRVIDPKALQRKARSYLLTHRDRELRAALDKIGKWTLEIIKRSDAAKGFKLLPRRWVVERTFAWLNRNRRLAKDFENSIESATAWLFMASVQLINRKLARPCN